MIPIITNINSPKTYKNRKITIEGYNFTGNIIVYFNSSTVVINDNSNDNTISIKTPDNLEQGKYKLSVALFEYSAGNIVPGYKSNEVDLMVFDSLRSSLDNFCKEYSIDQYTAQLTKLWKPGKFALKIGANLNKLLKVVARECHLFNLLMNDIFFESSPFTTEEFLGAWEVEYGLPEPCSTRPPGTIEDRKKELQRKALSEGNASPEYFEGLCRQLGVDVTITTESEPMMLCTDNCVSAVVPQEMSFVWYVNVFNSEENFMSCIDPCTYPLRWTEGQDIECFLNQIKPAHTIIVFRYFTGGKILSEDDQNLITEDGDNILAES